PPKQRQIPETIVDPSIALSKKRKRGEGDGKDSQSSNVIPLDDDLAKFVDSRGTGPRRRTEEGYLIYKEDELGIRESGGGERFFSFRIPRNLTYTPLCPFDCHCC
ncbi:uncharacterized protein EI90DRAFT_2845666, partial [Cantharellus anzutake]|uniref:uncharacterized protein n=1 Tax=Cantharellus anzutake TaxID=1750568 RepID=UPI00190601A3